MTANSCSRLLAMCLLWLAPACLWAAGSALDSFLDGLTTWRAEFTQNIVDAQGKEIEAGGGRILVQRPGRFRWEYTAQGDGKNGDKDAGQLLVADGNNLWFYERDLAQATVKPLDAALSSTPMMLLSGDAAALAGAFTITPAAARDGLAWIDVTPRSAGADFSRAQLGFGKGTLQRMIINDKLGQTVTLRFSRSQRNVPLAAADLQFVPPPGVDVIGKAQR